MSPRTSTPPKPYGWFPALTRVILAVIHVVNQLARAEGHAASSPSQALLAAYKITQRSCFSDGQKAQSLASELDRHVSICQPRKRRRLRETISNPWRIESSGHEL
ncbi:hypothetical protein BN1723_002543 [Verticillium longisporum]|uniref:Uncharacterized protein n=1 Tax=Verticillium longisporum TaxID=100787 RepID=A0A0G4LCC0_VERLO|nr:hypothetical protein BN1723_002543 [Verticillium longisporum]